MRTGHKQHRAGIDLRAFEQAVERQMGDGGDIGLAGQFERQAAQLGGRLADRAESADRFDAGPRNRVWPRRWVIVVGSCEVSTFESLMSPVSEISAPATVSSPIGAIAGKPPSAKGLREIVDERELAVRRCG